MAIDPAHLNLLCDLEQTATPRPWALGDVWVTGVVLPDQYGAGRCTWCRNGPPVWAGDEDVDGTTELVHRHHADPVDPDHQISGADGAYITGNYDPEDPEAFGIVNPDDARFIVAARNLMPQLLAELNRLRARVDELESAARKTLIGDDIADLVNALEGEADA